ncbi:hypothetical protein CF54_18150 [Streptomyces sp. Tu 6176]|nr:hypothetical protein CF54_18150 [Streptomyces sp. Tu 6176]
MWPGEQPPGGGQHPQQPVPGQQPGPGQQPVPGQQPNPYQQPGYHQPNAYQQPSPYQQGPQPWDVPTRPMGGPPQGPQGPSGPPGPPRPPGGGRNRTALVAVVAAAAVVVAAGVTGYAVLGGKDDEAGPGPTPNPTISPSTQQSSANPRDAGSDTATVKGWKVVVNPEAGIKFDVPPEWGLKSTGWVTFVADNKDPDDKPLIGMRAPAFLKEQWCASDEDRDGRVGYTPLAGAGSRGNNGARTTEGIAHDDPRTWVYGQYTQPDKAKITSGPVEPFTSASGLRGSLGSAWSTGIGTGKKCVTNGKAWTFAFKNAQGDLQSWSFFAAKGVDGEVPDATARKIAATVRVYQPPST